MDGCKIIVVLSNKAQGLVRFQENIARDDEVSPEGGARGGYRVIECNIPEIEQAPSALLRLYQDETNATYLSDQQHCKPLKNIFMLWAKSPVVVIQRLSE